MLLHARRELSVVTRCVFRLVVILSVAVPLPCSSAQNSRLPAAETKPTATPRDSTPEARDNASKQLLEEFQQTYALPDGKFFKRVLPPFSPGRMEYYRVHHATQAQYIPQGPDYMSFGWGDEKRGVEGKLHLEYMFGDGQGGKAVGDLVVDFTRIEHDDLQGDEALINRHVPGDWVVRDGVPPEEMLHEIEAVLRNECKVPVRLRLVQKDCRVIVAEGKYTFHPLPGNADYTDEIFEPVDRIDVYEKDRCTPMEERGGCLDEVLSCVSMFIRRPVINEVSRLPENLICCRYSARRYNESRKHKDADEAAILKHVSEQTGLTFSEKTRHVRMLLIERAK